jgi:hypothetical protein
MNQPQNPVPPRGDRPQLFKAPSAASKANAKRHADFGPSILATIDGGQARFTSPRDRLPVKRVLFMGVLALVAAATYVGVKFSATRMAAPRDAVVARAPLPATAKPADVPTPAPQAVAMQGVAAIETVTPASSAASSAAPNMAASLNNIQLALDRSEPAALPAKDKGAAKEVAKPRAAAPVVTGPGKTAAKTVPSSEVADADLLAAMLPHLKRGVATPTSVAYEKRCGQLTGEAVVDCRAKFCNGRQGVDAACPAAPAPR